MIINNWLKHKICWILTQFVWLSGTGRLLCWLSPWICISKPLNTELIHLSKVQWAAGCLELNRVLLTVLFSLQPTEQFEGDFFFLFHNWGSKTWNRAAVPGSHSQLTIQPTCFHHSRYSEMSPLLEIKPLLHFPYLLLNKQRIFSSLHWYCNFHSGFHDFYNRLVGRQFELWGLMLFIFYIH